MTPPEPAPRDHFEVAHLRSDLGGRALRGGAWTVAGQAVSLGISTVGIMVLARLLDPADFGLVAMASALVGAMQMFSDGGLGQATVQRGSLTAAQVSTLFWANVGLAMVVGGLIAAAGPAVSLFYGDDRLTGITAAVGAVVAIGGLGIQHTALLRRQMRFRSLAWIQIASTFAGWSASIALAMLGFGYWALVANNAAFALTGIALAWILCDWRPGPLRRGTGAWPLMRFGGAVSLAGFANYLSRNADNILIGKFLGETPLGIYDRAYQLMLKPVRKANAPISAVLAPTLSRLGDDAKAFEAVCTGLFRVMSYCAAPPVVALAVFADEAVLVLLGDAWTEAAEPFRWLSLACAAQIVTLQAGNMFIAQGCGRLFLQFSAANALIVTGAFAAGLAWGITGVSLCYAVACVAVCTPLLVFMLSRTPRLGLGPVARATLPGILLAAALCAALPSLRGTLQASIGAIGAAAATAGVLVATYAAVLRWTPDGRAAIAELRRAIGRLRRGRTEGAQQP